MVIDKIRYKANEKYLLYIVNNIEQIDDEDKEMFILINDLLKDDNCFLKIDMRLAINMLIAIGYTKEEAKLLYVDLIKESKKNLNGKYILVGEQPK